MKEKRTPKINASLKENIFCRKKKKSHYQVFAKKSAIKRKHQGAGYFCFIFLVAFSFQPYEQRNYHTSIVQKNQMRARTQESCIRSYVSLSNRPHFARSFLSVMRLVALKRPN